MQSQACEERGKTDLSPRPPACDMAINVVMGLLLFLKGLLLVRERKPCLVLRADTPAGMFRYHFIRTS